MKSVFTIAEELLNYFPYKYLLTYKHSQDHIEIFFLKIRQRFGYNNNPNVVEFRTCMKQMLLKNSVTSSYAANCVAFDTSCSESVFEIRWLKIKSSDTLSTEEEKCFMDNLTDEEEAIPDFLNEDEAFGIIKENILYYICGFIVRKI